MGQIRGKKVMPPGSHKKIRLGILVCSTSCAAGRRKDTGGDFIRRHCEKKWRAAAERFKIVPDDRRTISDVLKRWADKDRLDIILTTGGTGFFPTDVTPEATRAIIDREAPQLAAAILLRGLKKNPRAAISRAVAGMRKRCIIVNLPGSIGAVKDGLAVLDRLAPHMLELVAGHPGH